MLYPRGKEYPYPKVGIIIILILQKLWFECWHSDAKDFLELFDWPLRLTLFNQIVDYNYDVSTTV